jgi:hypothetical protein
MLTAMLETIGETKWMDFGMQINQATNPLPPKITFKPRYVMQYA